MAVLTACSCIPNSGFQWINRLALIVWCVDFRVDTKFRYTKFREVCWKILPINFAKTLSAKFRHIFC
jgi:hypothetical protein